MASIRQFENPDSAERKLVMSSITPHLAPVAKFNMFLTRSRILYS
jgi:hypothetical protein